MHKYLFLLGRQQKLSIAEINAVLGKGKLLGELYMVELADEIENPARLQDLLGGTIKIAKVVSEEKSLSEIEKNCIDYLDEHCEGKVIFSLSIYNFAHTFNKNLNNLLKNIKKSLKGRGRSTRFINKLFENVRSVSIYEEKLCEKGSDMTIVKTPDGFLLAKSLSVQNFKKYSIRDYERPGRDAKSGMLPPKLAQMMINIACGKNLSVVYDPFCGSGTVLMEALLQGHQVIGSDISEKAIEDTKKNVEWVKEKFMEVHNGVVAIFQADATALEKSYFPIIPRAVVGETYLGPAISKFPSENDRRKNFADVENIFIGALKSIKAILSDKTNLVFAIPFYKGRDKNYLIEGIDKKAKELGYEVVSFENSDTNRESLLYYRNGQLVGREIFHFKIG